MDFFTQQERARRRTWALFLLFWMAVAAIVVAVNGVVLWLLPAIVPTPPEAKELAPYVTTAITLSLILGSMLYRIWTLRAGGSRVAMSMGATLVTAGLSDPQLRQLHNVVEEMALASGVPVPAVFVMEDESGINAFAAGFAPTDAAIAVTRGTLEMLDRNELQGVVAHEFSHILNGDMRLNIRLMGVLYGILNIGIVGRVLLRGGTRRDIRRGRRGGGHIGVMMLGFMLMLIGYIGTFFGKLIQARVSREREYLADAAAVQFTREPQGIAGALKKIAASSSGSRLRSGYTGEVSHMLFAKGLSSFTVWSFFEDWLATHPPLPERITLLDSQFQPEELAAVSRSLHQRREARAQALAAKRLADTDSAAKGRPEPLAGGLGQILPVLDTVLAPVLIPGVVLTGGILAEGAALETERLAEARRVIESIPKPLLVAVHDPETVVPVLLLLLFGRDEDLRETRRQHLVGRISFDARLKIDELIPHLDRLDDHARFPLLELALPALRQRSPATLRPLRDLIDQLARIDGGLSVFEYAVVRLVERNIADILEPSKARPVGSADFSDSAIVRAAEAMLAVAAMHAAEEDPVAASAAFAQGSAVLRPALNLEYATPEDWVSALDSAVVELDGLGADGKRKLIDALLAVFQHDGVIHLRDAELFRIMAALVHVPVPLFPLGAVGEED
jgi:Zn-dependent protease with chaperone function